MSARTYIDSNNKATTEFVITGNDTQQVLIKGIAIDEGIDPTFALFKHNGNTWDTIITNDDDAGILIDLEPGVYSVQLSSNNGAGLALVSVDIIEYIS